MKTLDITYRYDGSEPDSRQPPGDAEAARLRLDAGSRTISALLNSETDGEARHVIHLDPRDLGLGQGAPAQQPGRRGRQVPRRMLARHSSLLALSGRPVRLLT